jgi:hypothetical protein
VTEQFVEHYDVKQSDDVLIFNVAAKNSNEVLSKFSWGPAPANK